MKKTLGKIVKEYQGYDLRQEVKLDSEGKNPTPTGKYGIYRGKQLLLSYEGSNAVARGRSDLLKLVSIDLGNGFRLKPIIEEGKIQDNWMLVVSNGTTKPTELGLFNKIGKARSVVQGCLERKPSYQPYWKKLEG